MTENATPAEALRIEAADRLIARQISTDWTEENQQDLEQWLETPANRLAYLRLQAVWTRAQRLEAARPLRRPHSAPTAPSRRPFSLKFAAAALIACAIGGSTLYLSQPDMRSYATKVGERQTLTLTDGSTIALNTNTVLKLSTNSNARMAVLEKGEAVFQIQHDSTRPFIVTASGHRIIDLGTKFLVREDGDKLKVSLIEGRARVETAPGSAAQRSATLLPGEVVLASANTLTKSKAPLGKLKNEESWQRGQLVFEAATLADAARELNRYNTQKLIITDSAAAKLTFDATIPTNGVETFIRVAQQVFGLHIKREADTVIVSR